MFQSKSKASRLTEAYIVLLLAVFPLFTGPGGYDGLTLHKYIFFTGTTLLWLLGLAVIRIAGRAPLPGKNHGAVSAFLLLYLVFCLVSGLFSPYGRSVLLGEGRFDGLLTILLCLLIFFAVSRLGRPRIAYLYAAAAGAFFSCLIAIFQLLGKNPLTLFPSDYFFYDAGIKFSAVFLGTIGNADLFSAHLCLVLPLLGVFYIRAPKRPLALLVALPPISFCLFACGVSAGILALGVTVLAAAPFVIDSGERLRRALELGSLVVFSAFLDSALDTLVSGRELRVLFVFSRFSRALILVFFVLLALRFLLRSRSFSARGLQRFFLVFSAASALGTLALVYFFGSRVGGTVFELHELLHGRIDDRFGSSRIRIWRETLPLFFERPILGGGPGTLALRLKVEFSRFVEETGKTLSTVVDNAHNDYLGILINCGLPALLAYLSAQAVSLAQAVKNASPFALALGASLLCYWISSFFGLGLFLVSPLMWLFWGLLTAELKINRPRS